MFQFFGAYEKHDWVVPVSLCLSAFMEKEACIVTDDFTTYKYFEGEISGVRVSSFPLEGYLHVYDMYRSIVADLEEARLILCANMSRNSLDVVKDVQSKVSYSGLVLETQASSFSTKYVETYLVTDIPTFIYSDGSQRRIDMGFNGKINFKNLDDGFLKSLGKFLVSQAGVPQNQLSSLWKFLKGRG